MNADVRDGTTRFDTHVGLQEAFVEKKLFDLSSNYDFVSVRAGIQELSTDFRGFVAVVEQPGVRVFGTLASSRIEYNVAFFDFLEKDTNSGFNELHRRHQQMAVANVYIQDFLTPGYTTQFSFHYNHDAGEPHYDTNGFLVRPAPIGLIAAARVRTSYLGWAGNGHIGRFNVSHAFYQAIGTDELNPIEAREVDINAQMAALELSLDQDWLRFKGVVLLGVRRRRRQRRPRRAASTRSSTPRCSRAARSASGIARACSWRRPAPAWSARSACCPTFARTRTKVSRTSSTRGSSSCRAASTRT